MARSLSSGPAVVFTPDATWDHYAFPMWVECGNGDLYVVVRRATSHSASDGVLVGKRCPSGSDPGLTASWGSLEVLSVNSATLDDRPGGSMRRLASGRVVMVWQRWNNQLTSPTRQHTAWSAYSDDDCASWSTPVEIATGHYATLACPSDIVELANGHVLCVTYGCPTNDINGQWDVRLSRSTDACVSWADYAGVNADGTVWSEPQMALLDDGRLLLTVADVSPVPQPQYKLFSTNAGHTAWSSPVQVLSDSVNRQALSRTLDGTFVLAGGRSGSHYFNESLDSGASFQSAISVGSNQAPYVGPTWTTPERFGAAGVSPNLGFAWSNEASGQSSAETYFSTFTAQPVPAITASDVAGITDTAATITGNVNPNGAATTYHVEYGLTTGYGSQTSPVSAGSGSSPVAVEVDLTGLDPDTDYHARLVAVSANGTTNGPDIPFTTDALVAVGRSLALPFNVNATVGRSVEISYGVAGAVGRSLALPWNVNATVGRSLQISYGIETVGYPTMRLLIPAPAPYPTRRTLLDTLTPVGPFTATGTTRRHASAAGSSRGHATLTGGPTP